MNSLLKYMMPIQLQVGEGAEWLPSLVVDFREGEELVVGIPTVRGVEVPVEQGDRLAIQTMHPDGIRRFSSEVLHRRNLPAPCLYLKWPDDEQVERIQRRQHVRVQTLVPTTVRRKGGAESRRSIEGSTTSLSAGGARLSLPVPLAVNSYVDVELHLPEQRTLVCGARVVTSGEAKNQPRSRGFWAALQFIGVQHEARRELTRFVFDVQREQLRKGVL